MMELPPASEDNQSTPIEPAKVQRPPADSKADKIAKQIQHPRDDATPAAAEHTFAQKDKTLSSQETQIQHKAEGIINPYLAKAKQHQNYFQNSKRLAEVSEWITDTNKPYQSAKEKHPDKAVQFPFPVGTWVLRPSSSNKEGGPIFITLQYLKTPVTWDNARIEVLDNGYRMQGKIYKSLDDLVRASKPLTHQLSEVFSEVREKCMIEQPPYSIHVDEGSKAKFLGLELTTKNIMEKLEKMWVDAKCEGPLPFHLDNDPEWLIFNMSMFQLKACGHVDPAFKEIFGRGKTDNKTRFERLEQFSQAEDHFSLIGSSPDKRFRTQMLVHEADWKLSQMDPKYSILSKPSEMTPEATLNHWLTNENVEGVFIGEESHGDLGSKRILIENMKHLKEAGVTTLFMEFIEYDGGQKALDNYFNSKNPDSDIPPEVASILKEQDDHYGFKQKDSPGFLDVVRAAKSAGIRIVGLESEASSLAGYSSSGSEGTERLGALNYNAKMIIDKEKGHGKFIALMGVGHVVQHEGVIGMSQIMGLPSMVVSDRQETKSDAKGSSVEFSEGFDVKFYKEVEGKAHAAFSIPVSKHE